MTVSPIDVRVDRHVRVRGLTVRVRVQGEGDPLLLLNGLARPLESWGPFVEALDHRTVVSFDAPGVGDSAAPVLPLSIEALADLAASVLDHVGLDQVDVLGISHGGAVAQHLAYRSAHRLRRLVLVSTSCGVGSTPGSWEALGRTDPAEDADETAALLGAWWHSVALASWSSIPYLGALDVPTLVVCGSEDDVTPPANSRLLASRIPRAQLVIIPGGHDLQQPTPARELARVVRRFFNQPPMN
jgi:poly(3-hydroxyoctanoate) depolymerase